jgi:GT2 family glycosyltransferase
MKKSLAIVVLTWNDFENTKNCIKNIYPQLNNKTKLILVDNNSKKDIYDRTIDWIKKNYTKNYIKVKINSKLNFKKKFS